MDSEEEQDKYCCKSRLCFAFQRKCLHNIYHLITRSLQFETVYCVLQGKECHMEYYRIIWTEGSHVSPVPIKMTLLLLLLL